MRCPNCQRTLLQEHDEGYCLVHGTVNEPARRAWDAVETPAGQPRHQHDQKCIGCGSPTYRTNLCVPCADRLRRQRNKATLFPG